LTTPSNPFILTEYKNPKMEEGGMLRVAQYEYIRTGFRVYGLSKAQLARKTGHSRNIVRKVLQDEYTGYTKRGHQPYPVVGPFMKVIDSWLEDDKEQHRKQRHTARRIYHRLVKEHGYQGSEVTVRRYVRQAKARLGLGGQKAFIPGLPDVGQEAEVDWGDARAVIAGKTSNLKLFCMRSKYSGKCFVRAYPVERQQTLFDVHILAFDFFGGVFPGLIYDNLTTAISFTISRIGDVPIKNTERAACIANCGLGPSTLIYYVPWLTGA
jgi:transposase